MTLRRVISRILRPLRQSGLKIGRSAAAPFESIEADGLRATCHRDLPTDPAFASAWEQLADRTPSATTFHRFAWQRGMIQRYASPGRLRLITVHRRDDLLAVLPLSLEADGTLETPGHWVSDYLDPLVSSADEPGCWRLILRLLSSLWDRSARQVVLHNVRHSAGCRPALASLAEECGFGLEQTAAETTSVISLEGGWDAYLATLDGHHRRETLRRLRKAETQAGARLVVHTEADQIAAPLDTALTMMEAIGGEKGEATHKFLRPLLMKLVPELCRAGQCRLQMLMLNDRPAAAMIMLPGPGGPMSYNTGFDVTQRQWNPGTVALTLALRDAAQAGATCFDLLRGREPYKAEFGAKEQTLYRLTLRPQTEQG